VHRRCIGQGHFVQLANVIGDESPLKVNLDLAFLRIHLGYLPDIAVVDVLLVVIDRLEDFIARGIGPAKSGDLGRGIRVESLLEDGVEGPCPGECSPFERGQESEAVVH
jgi:hypothetical protein